jgi:nitroimidazol reductase NimA-like FMN-containing flavoprotein (pyridoxamine 5'-phosphate oxidase superfamily)
MERRHDDMGLIRLEEDECWRFLARHSLGRVGLVHMEHPMVFPVNYALDGRSVVFRTAPGTKLAIAAAGRPVAFEVDEVTELFETGTSVVVHGTMREVVGGEDRTRLERLSLRVWAPGDRDRFVRIEPEWVTGRRIPHHQRDDGVAADGG